MTSEQTWIIDPTNAKDTEYGRVYMASMMNNGWNKPIYSIYGYILITSKSGKDPDITINNKIKEIDRLNLFYSYSSFLSEKSEDILTEIVKRTKLYLTMDQSISENLIIVGPIELNKSQISYIFNISSLTDFLMVFSTEFLKKTIMSKFH